MPTCELWLQPGGGGGGGVCVCVCYHLPHSNVSPYKILHFCPLRIDFMLFLPLTDSTNRGGKG